MLLELALEAETDALKARPLIGHIGEFLLP